MNKKAYSILRYDAADSGQVDQAVEALNALAQQGFSVVHSHVAPIGASVAHILVLEASPV